MVKKDGIKIEGHRGTWGIIDTTIITAKTYYLLEHETLGDLTPCIIIDSEGTVILEDVYNGFLDLREYLGA